MNTEGLSGSESEAPPSLTGPTTYLALRGCLSAEYCHLCSDFQPNLVSALGPSNWPFKTHSSISTQNGMQGCKYYPHMPALLRGRKGRGKGVGIAVQGPSSKPHVQYLLQLSKLICEADNKSQSLHPSELARSANERLPLPSRPGVRCIHTLSAEPSQMYFPS